MGRPSLLGALRCVSLLLLVLVAACAGGLPEPNTVPVGAWGDADTPGGRAAEPWTDAGALPELRLAEAGRPLLPLRHTHVKARLAGLFAEVEVSQTYINPFDRAIETVYVFPLPDNAAVDRLRFVIGARVVEAEIRERGEARKTYEAAKAEGHTAALLEEERPNVFTQSVANIPPGAAIDVVVHYLQDLTYDAGEIEFVFPMVVAPRYIPGTPTGDAPTGTGTRADTDRVPDASRVTPPVLPEGQRTGHDISIDVDVDAGGPVQAFDVPTHEVVARRPADGSLHLTLAEKDSVPNRDFVLRYRVSGKAPKAVLYTSGEGRGSLALVVQPPALAIDRLVGRREIIFVVDVSGSMTGLPLAMCRAAMRDALHLLRPSDTFDVMRFSGSTGRLFPAPRRATDAAIREAIAFVDGMEAGGGTEMGDAVAASLESDVEKGRSRYVFFMTDGLTGEEDRIAATARAFVAKLQSRGQTARVFGFGVGSSVDRDAIESLSRAGRGVAVFATNREDPARAVNRFFRYIDRSVVRDLTIDWGGARVTEAFPRELPDLFASHPFVVHARYAGGGPKTVVVHGMAGDEQVEIPVTARLSATPEAPESLLTKLWARSKIASLEEELWAEPDTKIEQAITRLGLEHKLVTKFTSFVAVDRSQTTGDGHPTTIVQPVDVPEDVHFEKAGAGSGSTIQLTGPLAGSPAVRHLSGNMYAVQQIYALRAQHLELAPHFAMAVGDPFADQRGFGGSLDYYATNIIAFGVRGTYYRGLAADSGLDVETRQATGVDARHGEYAWSALGTWTVVPAAGKILTLGDWVLHSDLFLGGGLGAIATRPFDVVDPEARAFDFTPRFAFQLGAGLRFFFARWFAARLAVDDVMFFDRLENAAIAPGLDASGRANARNSSTWLSDESTFTSNVQVELGLSVFLPTP